MAKKEALGSRYNEDKPQLHLISSLALKGMSRVLMFGLKKYAAWNWAKGLPVHETIDSLERHCLELREGKTIDDESGLPIVDHIQCNAMFLSHFYHSGMWDDLSGGLQCHQLASIHKESSGHGESRRSPRTKSKKRSKTRSGRSSEKA